MVFNRKRKDNRSPSFILDDSPKRTKVQAQRKFAQGSNVNSPVLTPVKEIECQEKIIPEPIELIPMKRPNTEDFLTFLCFRGTPVLPPSLNFFNNASMVDTRPQSSESPSTSPKNGIIFPTTISKSQGERPFIAFGVRKRADPIVVSRHMDKKRRHALALQALRRKYQEQKMAKIRAITISKLSEKVQTNKTVVRTTRSVTKSDHTITKKNMGQKTKITVVSTKRVKVTTRRTSTLKPAVRSKVNKKQKMCLRSYRGRFVQRELLNKPAKKRSANKSAKSGEDDDDGSSEEEFSSDDDEPLLKRVEKKAAKKVIKKTSAGVKKPSEITYRLTRSNQILPRRHPTQSRIIVRTQSTVKTPPNSPRLRPQLTRKLKVVKQEVKSMPMKKHLITKTVDMKRKVLRGGRIREIEKPTSAKSNETTKLVPTTNKKNDNQEGKKEPDEKRITRDAQKKKSEEGKVVKDKSKKEEEKPKVEEKKPAKFEEKKLPKVEEKKPAKVEEKKLPKVEVKVTKTIKNVEIDESENTKQQKAILSKKLVKKTTNAKKPDCIEDQDTSNKSLKKKTKPDEALKKNATGKSKLVKIIEEKINVKKVNINKTPKEEKKKDVEESEEENSLPRPRFPRKSKEETKNKTEPSTASSKNNDVSADRELEKKPTKSIEDIKTNKKIGKKNTDEAAKISKKKIEDMPISKKKIEDMPITKKKIEENAKINKKNTEDEKIKTNKKEDSKVIKSQKVEKCLNKKRLKEESKILKENRDATKMTQESKTSTRLEEKLKISGKISPGFSDDDDDEMAKEKQKISKINDEELKIAEVNCEELKIPERSDVKKISGRNNKLNPERNIELYIDNTDRNNEQIKITERNDEKTTKNLTEGLKIRRRSNRECKTRKELLKTGANVNDSSDEEIDISSKICEESKIEKLKKIGGLTGEMKKSVGPVPQKVKVPVTTSGDMKISDKTNEEIKKFSGVYEDIKTSDRTSEGMRKSARVVSAELEKSAKVTEEIKISGETNEKLKKSGKTNEKNKKSTEEDREQIKPSDGTSEETRICSRTSEEIKVSGRTRERIKKSVKLDQEVKRTDKTINNMKVFDEASDEIKRSPRTDCEKIKASDKTKISDEPIEERNEICKEKTSDDVKKSTRVDREQIKTYSVTTEVMKISGRSSEGMKKSVGVIGEENTLNTETQIPFKENNIYSKFNEEIPSKIISEEMKKLDTTSEEIQSHAITSENIKISDRIAKFGKITKRPQQQSREKVKSSIEEYEEESSDSSDIEELNDGVSEVTIHKTTEILEDSVKMSNEVNILNTIEKKSSKEILDLMKISEELKKIGAVEEEISKENLEGKEKISLELKRTAQETEDKWKEETKIHEDNDTTLDCKQRRGEQIKFCKQLIVDLKIGGNLHDYSNMTNETKYDFQNTREADNIKIAEEIVTKRSEEYLKTTTESNDDLKMTFGGFEEYLKITTESNDGLKSTLESTDINLITDFGTDVFKTGSNDLKINKKDDILQVIEDTTYFNKFLFKDLSLDKVDNGTKTVVDEGNSNDETKNNTQIEGRKVEPKKKSYSNTRLRKMVDVDLKEGDLIHVKDCNNDGLNILKGLNKDITHWNDCNMHMKKLDSTSLNESDVRNMKRGEVADELTCLKECDVAHKKIGVSHFYEDVIKYDVLHVKNVNITTSNEDDAVNKKKFDINAKKGNVKKCDIRTLQKGDVTDMKTLNAGEVINPKKHYDTNTKKGEVINITSSKSCDDINLNICDVENVKKSDVSGLYLVDVDKVDVTGDFAHLTNLKTSYEHLMTNRKDLQLKKLNLSQEDILKRVHDVNFLTDTKKYYDNNQQTIGEGNDSEDGGNDSDEDTALKICENASDSDEDVPLRNYEAFYSQSKKAASIEEIVNNEKLHLQSKKKATIVMGKIENSPDAYLGFNSEDFGFELKKNMTSKYIVENSPDANLSFNNENLDTRLKRNITEKNDNLIYNNEDFDMMLKKNLIDMAVAAKKTEDCTEKNNRNTNSNFNNKAFDIRWNNYKKDAEMVANKHEESAEKYEVDFVKRLQNTSGKKNAETLKKIEEKTETYCRDTDLNFWHKDFDLRLKKNPARKIEELTEHNDPTANLSFNNEYIDMQSKVIKENMLKNSPNTYLSSNNEEWGMYFKNNITVNKDVGVVMKKIGKCKENFPETSFNNEDFNMRMKMNATMMAEKNYNESINIEDLQSKTVEGPTIFYEDDTLKKDAVFVMKTEEWRTVNEEAILKQGLAMSTTKTEEHSIINEIEAVRKVDVVMRKSAGDYLEKIDIATNVQTKKSYIVDDVKEWKKADALRKNIADEVKPKSNDDVINYDDFRVMKYDDDVQLKKIVKSGYDVAMKKIADLPKVKGDVALSKYPEDDDDVALMEKMGVDAVKKKCDVIVNTTGDDLLTKKNEPPINYKSAFAVINSSFDDVALKKKSAVAIINNSYKEVSNDVALRHKSSIGITNNSYEDGSGDEVVLKKNIDNVSSEDMLKNKIDGEVAKKPEDCVEAKRPKFDEKTATKQTSKDMAKPAEKKKTESPERNKVITINEIEASKQLQDIITEMAKELAAQDARFMSSPKQLEAKKKKPTVVKKGTKLGETKDRPKLPQRPSRKTKEAAAIYMEILGHKLGNDEGDDDISIDSFPELPNVRKMEQRENELKAKAQKENPPEEIKTKPVKKRERKVPKAGGSKSMRNCTSDSDESYTAEIKTPPEKRLRQTRNTSPKLYKSFSDTDSECDLIPIKQVVVKRKSDTLSGDDKGTKKKAKLEEEEESFDESDEEPLVKLKLKKKPEEGKQKRECTKKPQNYLPLFSSSDDDEKYFHGFVKCESPPKPQVVLKIEPPIDLLSTKDVGRRYGKEKVNMSNEQIEKWLNDSALAGMSVIKKENDEMLKFGEKIPTETSLENLADINTDGLKTSLLKPVLKEKTICSTITTPEKYVSAAMRPFSNERKTIFRKEKCEPSRNVNAFSVCNESSVYAFEADNEDSISTPFRRPNRRPSSTATSRSEDDLGRLDAEQKIPGKFRHPNVIRTDCSKLGFKDASLNISTDESNNSGSITAQKTLLIPASKLPPEKPVKPLAASSPMCPPTQTTTLQKSKLENRAARSCSKSIDRISDASEEFKYKIPSSPSASSSSSAKLYKRNAKSRPPKGPENYTPVNVTEFPTLSQNARIVEAPVFHPNEKEFVDPIEYIEKIREKAQKFGICRIVPPPNFKPECKVLDEMRFTAYNQYVHKMMHRWGPNFRELVAIRKYLATQSISLKHPPWIGGMEIDLPRLYQTVQILGGLKEVIEKKKWPKVSELMKIPKSAQDRVTKLDDIYCKYLLPYDTLSPDERDKLFDSVETEWAKRESKNLMKAQQNTDDEERKSEDEEMESEDEEDIECIVKGRSMALNTFFRIARNSMATWFKNPEPDAQEVEEEFWKHVTTKKYHICVHSGSIDSGNWGYGFAVSKNSPFARHAWNLKVLTNNSGSVLRSMGPVMGLTVPTLHVGMVFSGCCWYRDPHGLPWIEYLHTGANKIWYGIPDTMSEKFHTTLLNLVPNYCLNKSIWLPSDTVMLPPELLVDSGVSLTRTVQKPGQFVVIFPKAFTSNICTGYVVSESVFFAPPHWLDSAEYVFEELRNSCEPSMFSYERLLLSVANDSRSDVKVLKQIVPAVGKLCVREKTQREELKALGVTGEERLPVPDNKKKKKMHECETEYACEDCRWNLFCSMVFDTQENGIYCLEHAIKHLRAKILDSSKCRLMYTYDAAELDVLVKNLNIAIEMKLQKKSYSRHYSLPTMVNL